MKQNIRDDMPSRARHLSRLARVHARARAPRPDRDPGRCHGCDIARDIIIIIARARERRISTICARRVYTHTYTYTHTLHVPRRRRGLSLDGNLAESGGLRECAHRKGRRVRIACACEDRPSATLCVHDGIASRGLVPGHDSPNACPSIWTCGPDVVPNVRSVPPSPDRKHTRA